MCRILTVLSLLAVLATSVSAADGLTPAAPQCNSCDCSCSHHGSHERLSLVPSTCQVPGCRGCGLAGHCRHCGHGGPCGHGGGFFGALTGCDPVNGCQGGCLNTCNMPPHYAYYPADHGNYYFRPYNYHRIPRHQQFVLSWGGDPRHPYANTVFDRVYASLAEELPGEIFEDSLQPAPGTDPFLNDPAVPPARPFPPARPMPPARPIPPVPPAVESDAVESDAVESDAVESDAVESDAVESDAVESNAVESNAVEPLESPFSPPAAAAPSLDQDTSVKPTMQDASVARFVKVPASRKAEQAAAGQGAIRVQFITPVE